MVKLKTWRVIYTLYQLIWGISASNHWIVTENGLIQPMLDSPFNMRLPNDLMAFLEQDRRFGEIDSLYHNLISRKFVFEEYSLEVPHNIESKLYETTEKCVKSGTTMEDIDLFISFAADGSDRDGIKLLDFVSDNSNKNNDGADIPDCRNYSQLSFSMFTFEHLKAMVERANISLAPETSLRDWLLPGTTLTSFGYRMTIGLQQNTSSWIHYNLASLYWRIKGDALNALECTRRAVYFAPREYRDIALLNMASIFHQSKYSTEAAVILHAAIDHAPRQHANHFALGNVYAVLTDYNRSIACYDNCLKLKPNYRHARINKYTVLCHSIYVKELMELFDSIQAKRTELRDYQEQHERWLRLAEKALREQAPTETGMADDNGKTSESSKACVQRPGTDPNSPRIVSCTSTHQNYNMYSILESRHKKINTFDIMMSIKMLLKNVEADIKKLSKEIANIKKLNKIFSNPDIEYSSISLKKIQGESPEYNDDEDVVPDTFIPPPILPGFKSSLKFVVEASPESWALPPKYPPSMKISRIRQDFDKRSDWPTSEECDEWMPLLTEKVNKHGEPLKKLHVFIPIDNKGYNTKSFLSDDIGVPLSEEHPLPWYPPVCCDASVLPIRSSYFPPSLDRVPNTDGDVYLREILISYTTDDKFTHIHDDAEIGQRILSAMKKKVAPKWILYNLASLYWRVRGSTSNGLDCLLCALSSAPMINKDVLLVSLGSILYNLGYVTESLKVTGEALTINKVEPATNFLLSILHMAKKNVIGQIYHMKQVVRVDPTFLDGWASSLLKAWHCQNKFSTQNKVAKEKEAKKVEPPEMCSETLEKEDTVELIKKPGGMVGTGIICTAGGKSCQPANIHCYKADSNEDFGEGYVPFNLVNKKPVEDTGQCEYVQSSEESTGGVLFKKLYLKIAENVNPEEDLGESDSSKVENYFESVEKASTENDENSCSFSSKPENIADKTPLTINLNFQLMDSSESSSDEADVSDLVKYSEYFPPDYHIEATQDLGKLIVSAGQLDDKNTETFYVYDKNVRFHLSTSTCTDISDPDWVRYPALWNIFEKRDIRSCADLIKTAKLTTYNRQLTPQCAAPRNDLVEELLMKPKLPPMPNNPMPALLPILRRLTGDALSPLEIFAAKITEALKNDKPSWMLYTLAGIYWSIEGDSEKLVACLRQSLQLAPDSDKDIPLLGIAAVLQWIGMTEDAFKLAFFAFNLRPDFAITSYQLGLLHVEMDQYEQSIGMFRKAIALDNKFNAAKSELKDILCLLLFGYDGVFRDQFLAVNQNH